MGANVNPRPVAPHAPEQYSNVPPSIPPTTPTSELRSDVYANVAAKPESELPRVYKPQGGTNESMLVTNPNTGEEIDEWGCAVTWLPILLVENAKQGRQTSAAIESFRNEAVRAHHATTAAMTAAAAIHLLEPQP